MVKINERVYPFQRWCSGQIQTTKKQPGEDKDASRSFPEGQSSQVCVPPCTPPYRVPGSRSSLLLPFVWCWTVTSWMALRINNFKLSLFLSEAHFIQKMRSLGTAANKYKEKRSSKRKETSCNTNEWSKQDLTQWMWMEGRERWFEKEYEHNLVRGLKHTPVSHCTFRRPGCTEEWGIKRSSLRAHWAWHACGKPKICTRCTLGITNTPQHLNRC